MNVLVAKIEFFFLVYLTGLDVERVIASSIAEMLSKFGVVAWSDTRMLRNYYRVKFAEVDIDVR